MTSIKKEIMEEFNEKFCNVYGGDSGLGGNDPQEPVDEWATDNPSDVRQWLSQALTRIEEETMEKALWCQFCGDELSCFGCEGIPGRTMEENRKLLLASLSPSEEKECTCIGIKCPTCLSGLPCEHSHCQKPDPSKIEEKLPSKSSESVVSTQSLRQQISEILVRWSMPTRQAAISELEQLMKRNIGMLRQWLNEDRITDPKKMVTNEEIEYWLLEEDK